MKQKSTLNITKKTSSSYFLRSSSCYLFSQKWRTEKKKWSVVIKKKWKAALPQKAKRMNNQLKHAVHTTLERAQVQLQQKGKVYQPKNDNEKHILGPVHKVADVFF